MKNLTLSVIALFALAHPHQASARDRVLSVPKNGKDAGAFLTQKATKTLTADLNGDKLQDLVVLSGDYLLVLFAESSGGYRFAGAAEGNFSEGDLEIEKNVVLAKTEFVGAQATHTMLYRLRWDPKQEFMRIIGLDFSQGNLGGGNGPTYDVSYNLMTGLEVRTEYAYVAGRSETEKTETRKKGSSRTLPMEAIGAVGAGDDDYSDHESFLNLIVEEPAP